MSFPQDVGAGLACSSACFGYACALIILVLSFHWMDCLWLFLLACVCPLCLPRLLCAGLSLWAVVGLFWLVFLFPTNFVIELVPCNLKVYFIFFLEQINGRTFAVFLKKNLSQTDTG
jgi:hypothetical protein